MDERGDFVILKFERIFAIALITFVSSISFSQSVSISLNKIQKPAMDLIDSNGEHIDIGDAAQMAASGIDLSLYEPEPNKMWDGLERSMTDDGQTVYPESTVVYTSAEAINYNNFSFLSRVESKEQPGTFFRLGLSRLSHSVMMRAALLRKLGFNIVLPKYYKKIRVEFESEEEKAEFIKMAEDGTITSLSDRKWILQNNTQDHSLVLAHAVIEPMLPDMFEFHWGTAPNPDFHSAAVERYSRFRAYRSLILPFSLVDIPESVNRYSPKLGSIYSDYAILTHPYAKSFFATTVDDARWLLRKMAKLSLQDLKQIVAASGMPAEIQEIVLAKMIYRINNAYELFNTKELQSIANPSLNIQSANGLVVDGKVTQEFIAGYPVRYNHGERTSPYTEGDLSRYLQIDARSSVLKTAIDKLNAKIQVLDVGNAVDRRSREIQNRINEHIKNNPDKPLYQKVETWGGPLFGFDVGASRHVATGTYYESSAPVQLIDNVRVGASLGYFQVIDGYSKFAPNFGGNVSVVRDYTHVRPIASLKAGTEVSWGDIAVPRYMEQLAEILESNEMIQEGEMQIQPVDKFLNDMQEGEVFTITESVSLTAYAQVSSSVESLMGLDPVSFMNSVSIGGDTSKVVLRQTSISKVGGGVQVYVRRMDTKQKGLTFDLNYFINILRIRAQTTLADIKTDAFIINYTPKNLIETSEVEKLNQVRDDLRLALRAIFKSNDNELLYGKFKTQKFEVDHKLETKEIKRKFLMFHSNRFSESHLLNIRYPAHPDYPEMNPEDEEVTLFTYKQGKLTGKDPMGLFLDVVDGFLQNSELGLARHDSDNPANAPFGKGKWRVVNSEVDISKNIPQLDSMASIQRVWGGWKMKKNDFFDLMDSVTEELEGLVPYRIIEKEAFHNVRSIDFYRITANASLLTKGLHKVRDLILQPDADLKPKPDYSRWPKRPRLMGEHHRQVRLNDKELFDEVITMYGNGDYKQGLKDFNRKCTKMRHPHEEGKDDWYYGSPYTCLTTWMKELIQLSHNYPKDDKQAQAKWNTEVLAILDQNVPLGSILKYLGTDNYVFFIRVNGFRVGDEDGDLEYFSNTIGDLKANEDLANGLVNYYARKTRISPMELDRSQGGFR